MAIFFPNFKILTIDSINEIDSRINQTIKNPNQNFFKARLIKHKEKNEFKKRDKRFDTGNILSDRLKQKFPAKLFGIPIEEIDENFKKEKVCRALDLRILNFLFYIL
jgi:hypothetical protein